MSDKQSTNPPVTPAELLTRIDAGQAPLILDVRSRREFAQGHVPGAVHIPFWQMGDRASSITAAAGDPIVVYCGHGPRAWMAAAALRRHGFRNVIYMAGDMAGWRKAGLREESS